MEMKLTEMTMGDYLDLLNSDAPAPGGGSACAFSAVQAAALITMVTELTIGKERYAEFQEGCMAAKAAAAELYEQLIHAADDDTAAFTAVSAAYGMPKGSDEERETRSRAIAEATLQATRVPFELMKMCEGGLELTGRLIGKSNPNVVSDLGVAATQFLAALKGAWLNVKINLPGIKDESLKAEFGSGEEIAARSEKLAEDIYDGVMSML